MTDQQQPEPQQHMLAPHLGEVLLRLANIYPTLHLSIVEAIQNAIDARAEMVFVGIDVRRRVVLILDNGDGVTVARFQAALQSIGKGIKEEGSLGRFGLGLIAPFNKCQRYEFVSKPRGERANWWLFEGEAIRQQHAGVTIPYESREVLPPIPAQFWETTSNLYAAWRTYILLSGVTDDRVISATNLDELEGDIRAKLGKPMRVHGTRVHIRLIDGRGRAQQRTVNPVDFTGEPLPVVTYHDELCGTATIRLFRARRSAGERRGEVLVARNGDAYSVPWREFTTQAMGSRWLREVKDAFDALGSGYFEGLISVERIELAPERTKFLMNDALRALYLVLHRWHEEHGQAQFEDEQEVAREKRYKELGQRSLARILGGRAFSSIAKGLSGILPEAPPRPRKTKPEPTPQEEADDARIPRKKRVVVGPPPTPSERAPRSRKPSFTLSFAYEALDSNRLWEYDIEEAVLTLNIRHPLWVKVDETDGKHTSKHDRWVMHLQEWLAMKLLVLLSRHEEPGFDLELVRSAIDAEVRPYVELFVLRT